LIYIPLIRNFFEVTFVEHENDQAMFYTLGRGRGGNVYVYALKLKQFVFSEEIISTGVQEIDKEAESSYKRIRLPLANTGTGSYVPGEIVYQGTSLANSTAQAIVYSYTPHSELTVIRVIGQFTSSANAIGNTSGALRTPVTVDELDSVGNNVFEDITDNKRIEQEADDILDFTETNPFGEP
jgi:hypothetical protein